jgi:hypothetical protein
MNIIKKPIPSAAYYLYWHFAYERQEVFFNRVNNKLILTEDEILGTYKFTNAYRASDRVSQYLIHNVLYSQNDYSNEDTMFRLLLFKIFNKIETWEYLEENIGEINWGSFDFHKYDRLLHESMDRGNKINKVLVSAVMLLSILLLNVTAVYAWFNGQGYIGKTMSYSRTMYIGADDASITNYHGYLDEEDEFIYTEINPLVGFERNDLIPSSYIYLKSEIENVSVQDDMLFTVRR